jgi:hypothetical protein
MLTVILLVVLALPTAVWAMVRWWPAKRDSQPTTASGIKHRWWQP